MDWIKRIWNSSQMQSIAFITIMFLAFGVFAELIIIGKCFYKMSLSPHLFWVNVVEWNEVWTWWYVCCIIGFIGSFFD